MNQNYTKEEANRLQPSQSDDYYMSPNQTSEILLQERDELSTTQARNNNLIDTNLGKVLYMTISFLFLFTPFMSASNLAAEIYSQLGYTSLGKLISLVLYVVFFISSFLTPGIIKNWSYKSGVFIGSFGYLFTVLSGLMTTTCATSEGLDQFWCSIHFVYAFNVVFAIINGFTAPILWLCVNRYITGCTNATNKGKYFGIFSSSIAASQVAGGVLSAFVIKKFGQLNFYMVATGLIFISILLIFFARPVPKYEETKVNTIKEEVKKILRLSFGERMRPFLLYCFLVGFIRAVTTGFEYEIIVNATPNESKEQQNYLTSVIFIIQGGIGVFSSVIAGKLADILRRRTILSIFTVFSAGAVALSFISFKAGSLVLCYFMAGFWGIGYSGALCLTNVVMAKDFKGTIESYAVAQAMLNIATIIGFGLSILLTNYVVTFLCLVLAVLNVTQISTMFYKQKENDEPLISKDES